MYKKSRDSLLAGSANNYPYDSRKLSTIIKIVPSIYDILTVFARIVIVQMILFLLFSKQLMKENLVLH